MDKLRALECFISAAEAGSFSAAARRLGVSVPAVAKMINALEARLGTAFFDRTTQGLSLTADGARYLAECRPLVEQLSTLDETLATTAARARGTVTVGAPTIILQHCLAPALSRFHARHPEIQLDLRAVTRLAQAHDASIDLLVLFGWFDAPDMVRLPLAQARFCVMATPAYWAAHGVPQRPADLTAHSCLVFRNPAGIALDLWEFHRGEERESIQVGGWACSDHRDLLLDLALAGQGVIRVTDLTSRALFKSGSLVPALADWEALYAPPAIAYFASKHRRSARVRVVLDFVAETFRRLESEREGGAVGIAGTKPDWYHTRDGRASSILRHR